MSIRDDDEFAKLEAALWNAESRLHQVRYYVGDSAAIEAAEQLVHRAAASLNRYIASREKSQADN